MANRGRGLYLALRRRLAASLCAAGLAAVAVGARADVALRECRLPGLAHSVQCGEIERPLDPAQPAGARLVVRFAVVPAMARRKLADPVFVLAGGPGQSALAIAPQVSAWLGRLNNRRDLVFVDQRGTGTSTALDCEDSGREPLSDATDPDRLVEAMARCRARLAQTVLAPLGGAAALRGFTTTIAMHDLEAVRLALGADRINLVAASYGTRAALEYQRLFPQALRRSVLDGVVPPDMALPASFSTDAQAAFDAVLAGCERQPACAGAYPALRADWKALLARLPLTTMAVDPSSGAPQPLRLTRDGLLGAVRGPLYAPALASALPAAIDAAAHGRYDALIGMASLLSPRKGASLAMGMHFSVVCAEDLPRLAASTDRPGADFGDDFARLYARVCEDWPRGPVDAAFYRVTPTRSATLLLSGGADPAAPPRHGERVARLLGPRARHLVVAEAGHGLMGLGCMRDVIYRFIDATSDDDALAVDAGCLDHVPRPLAFRPVAAAASAPSR